MDSMAGRKNQRQRAGGVASPFPPSHDDYVLTLAEWCALNRFSQRTGRRVIRSGNGPVVTRLTERLLGVRVTDNHRWQQSRARGVR